MASGSLGHGGEEAHVALRIVVVEYSGVPVVQVGGELDGAAAGEFLTTITAMGTAACPSNSETAI